MKKTAFEKYFLKTCSVITAACFLLTAIGGNLSASAVPASSSAVDAVFENLNVISPEYGKITSVSDSSGDITVVNIQDLHCHERTQRNISEIIKTLDKKYKLKSVFVEGGYGTIDVSWIDKIQDINAKQLIVEQMIKEGYLTGAEYFAIKNNKYGLLNGIEDKNTHEDNLKRLSLIMANQQKYKMLMSKINNEIEVLDNIYLNDRNKRFSLKINRYRAAMTDSLKYYRMLVKYAGKIKNEPEKYNNIVSINIEDYPNILGYIDLSRNSKNINSVKVSAELQAMVNIVKNKIPYNSYRKLIEETDNFRDTHALTDFLVVFCRMNNINLSKDFKELNAFFEASALSNRINPVELVNEERNLTEQIRMALSYDNTEYEIAYINDFSKYFGDYLTYSLTSSDWNYFKLNFAKFREIYSKYASVDRINEISDDIALLNEYYDTNDLRNDIFVSNILKDEVPLQNESGVRTSDDILKQSKEVIVVVSGGYHSQSLKSIFASKNINDIVITPNVTGDVSKADYTYGKIIKEQASFNSNALAFKLASCLSDSEQKSLLAKIAVDALGIENAEKLKNMIGSDIDLSDIKTEASYSDKQKKINEIIKTAVNAMVSAVPQDGGKNIFNPDIDNILIEMSLKLYDMGFYFENGAVYEIDSSEYKDKDLLGIPAEIYSRMFADVQRALLAVEHDKNKTSGMSIFNNLKNKSKIFSFLSKTAPVWEEIVFRAVPSLVMVFNPVLGISLFAVSQIAFLFSHSIVKWLVNKDSAGKRQKFSGILKNDLKNLSIPALTVAIPYILTAGAPISFLPVITLASMAIHYFYNRNNPGNPMIIAPSLKNVTAENVMDILSEYTQKMKTFQYVRQSIKLLDKNLISRIIGQSDKPEQTIKNIITKMQYLDPLYINAMESDEYVSDVFSSPKSLLMHLGIYKFDKYDFNLFFKFKNKADIKSRSFEMWLAKKIQDDRRFKNLDEFSGAKLIEIFKLFEFESNYVSFVFRTDYDDKFVLIDKLVENVFESKEFDFNGFFDAAKKFNLAKKNAGLEILYLSFNNGFKDFSTGIYTLSKLEMEIIAAVLRKNTDKNKINILNFRQFSFLKNLLKIRNNDEEDLLLLAKYCFESGNAIEKNKTPDKNNIDVFVHNANLVLKNQKKSNISGSLLADFMNTNVYFDEKQIEQIMQLLEEMTDKGIKNLDTNNDNLALKIFLSPAFNKVFNRNVADETKLKNIDNLIQRYRRAIAVSVLVGKLLNERLEFLTSDNFEKITEAAANAYFEIMKQWFNKKLADKNSSVTAIFNNESAGNASKYVKGDKFDPALLKKILAKIGIDSDSNRNVELLQRSKDLNAKNKLIDRIKNAPKNGQNSFFWFNGHGTKEGFYITDTEKISFYELADALYAAYMNGVDLKDMTLVFDSCYSGDFKNKILLELESKGIKEFPVIVTAAGHNQYGYAGEMYYNGEPLLSSNLEAGIFFLFENSSNIDPANNNLLLGDFILAQNNIQNSNPIISVSVTEDVKAIMEKAIKEINIPASQNYFYGENEDLNNAINTMLYLMSAKTAFLNKTETPSKSVELSIFGPLKNRSKLYVFLSKTAPVWEEIVFRAVPSLVMVFNPVLGISLFAVSQIAFLFSHSIVKWLVNKDSAGKRQKFSGILKNDLKNLSIPALTVAIPYILTAGAPISFLPVITLASMAIHYFYNRNNPGNPMIIFSGINGSSPENIIKTLHNYAVVFGYYDFVAERLKLLDKNLAAHIIAKSADPQQTALNIINKIKYVDPALLNGLESYEYALDIFDLDPFMLDYIRGMGFDGYKFNLFMKLRYEAAIQNKEYMNVWLANTIRGDSRFNDLDKSTVRGLATILKIYGPKENIETIEYLFKQMFEAESFDFGQFFKMTEQFNLTQNTDKLKLLQISFDNGFQNDAAEILDFSEEESSMIAKEIASNENKTTIFNVRLFSALKEMIDIKNPDADTVKFLVRYCFGKGNIVEKRKLNNNIQEKTFIPLFKAVLANSGRDDISVYLMADFTAANIELDEIQMAQVLELLKELTKMGIKNLAGENDNLALRVFLSRAFSDSFNGKVLNEEEFKNIDNIIQRYRRAIAVSVFMNKLLDGKTELLTPENFDRITAVASDAYFGVLRQWFNKELTDQDSFVTAVFHDESAEIAFEDMQGDRFDPAILKKFLAKIGIDADNSKNVDFLQRSKDPGVKIKLFDRIINSPRSGKKSLFWMHGHGSKDGFYITDTENISFQEFANALYTASKLGVDLKAMTFVFNSCHSGDFKDKILKELESKGVKDAPVIITIAGHETELGYTEMVKHEGEVLLASNLEFSIFNLFESSSNSDLQNKNLLLGDFVLAQNDVLYSNPTISIPVTADVKHIIENAKTSILSIVYSDKTAAAGQSGLVKTGISVTLDAARADKDRLPSQSVELSLLKPLKSKSKTLNVLSEAAPVWEELIFRMIPSIITVFNPVLGISLFAVSQIIFLFSHTIVKWIVNKDSAGGLKFIDIFKDDLRNLSLPTLAVSLPYIFVMSAAPLLWPLSTAAAIIIHSFFNNMSILKAALNAGFEIKLPIAQMGGIKEGDNILVTYISNDTILVSRNGFELQKFCRTFADKYTDNEEQKIIDIIYPKTFEFKVGANGIININKLVRSLRNPLALVPQKNLNIGYKPVFENRDENNSDNTGFNNVPITDNVNRTEEQILPQQNNTVAKEKEYDSVDTVIENELTARFSPKDVVELNFSEFINGKESYDIEEVKQYVNDAVEGRDLSDSLLVIKFSDSYVDISNEIKIKKAADILYVAADIMDEKFADRMGSSRGYTFFPELLENSFVHGNYLSLNKKIFIYFGSDKDVVVINAHTPEDRTIAALAEAGKLDLYGDGSGMLNAEGVNGAKYTVTDLNVSDGSRTSLFVAYMTFKKYTSRPSKFLKKILNKINMKAIWNTAETGKIEREYSYVEIPDIREGQTIKAGNFIADQMWYFCDWIEFSLSKINGQFVITGVKKTLNQNKIPVEKIKLEEKLDVVFENGKFYIRSDYTGIKFFNDDSGIQYADKQDESSDAAVEEQPEEISVSGSLDNITTADIGFEIVAGQVNTPYVRGQEIGNVRNLDYRRYLKRLYDRMTETFNFDQLESIYQTDSDRLSLIKYLKLLKLNNAGDTAALRDISYDKTIDVKYRLTALMYLKMNGFSKFNYLLLENIKGDFLKSLKDKTLDVKNNFDLSAVGAGILLILSDYLKAEKYIDDNKERELYEKISYSIFVSKNNMRNFAANAGMFFTNADPLTIAHEIGHRVLMFYADAGSNVSYSTLHEIFANAISAVFAQKAGIENKTYSDSLYELFNDKIIYDYVIQEEHKASSGLFYLVGKIAGILGKQLKFELLADAVVKMLSKNKALPDRQSDALKELLKEYQNLLKSKDGYTEEEISQFEQLLKEESWKTKVFEIFIFLKNANGTRWDYYGYRFESIMNQIRVSVENPESYLHGPLGLDYSKDLVVINNIIISQPEKINEALEIVKTEFLNGGTLLRSEIIKLIFIELIMSMPQLKELTKQQLDIIMQHIADEFFTGGVDYDPSKINYAEIKKSALVEYHLFKMFQPREINKKDSAMTALLKRNFFDDTYSAAKDDRYTSKTLPSFVPSIDSFFMVVGYRGLFDFVAGKVAKGTKRGMNPEIKKYLNMLRGSQNNPYLLKILYGWDLPLQYRLFAAMYLKINGYDLTEHSGVLDNIKREFISSVRNGTFKVRNNFDLRAMCTGVFLSIEDFADNFIDSRQQKSIYKKISKAVIVRRGKKQTAANNAFHFVYYDPFTIAHEIGHNILSALKFYGSNATAVTIHELFAEVTSNVFDGEISEYKTDPNAVLYDLFNETFDYEYVFQEEHKAARGFVNLIINASHTINRHVKWLKLAEVITGMVSDKTFVKQNQGAVLKALALRYFAETDAHNSVERILSEEQTYTVVNDILAELKKQSPKRYAVVIAKIKQAVEPPKSYRYAKKSKLDYDNDNVFINNVIMSQPYKIYDILTIIRSEILMKFYFSRTEMEILTLINILLNLNINRTRKIFLRNELIKNVNKLPKKQSYDMNDYYRMENHVNGNIMLTMDWLNKLLLFFGKKDFADRQKIVSDIEYPLIILGMFFPAVRNWFLNRHNAADRAELKNKLSKLETTTALKIKEILNFEVSDILALNIIKKLTAVSKILTNNTIKIFNKNEHIKLNSDAVLPDVQNSQQHPKSLMAILVLSIATVFGLTVFMHLGVMFFVFMMFPVMSLYTIIWSLFSVQLKRIYHQEKYETEYFSNVPETEYDYSGGSISVTVQIPVFKESNEVIFNTVLQSIKACSKYSEKSGASANVIISDDGLDFLLNGNTSRDNIEMLLNKDANLLNDDEKQAVERIRFYRANNVSFVARPKDGRVGLFKKASNLNYTYRLVNSLTNGNSPEKGAYYEGNSLYIGDIILLLDKDSQLHEDVISVTIPKFIKDDKLAFTQNSTLPSNENDNYFTKFLAPFTSFLFQHIFPANAISGGLVPFVGHNGFIRTKCLEEVGYWPENKVSEDFYTSVRFQTLGYTGKYLSFKGYEFKEMVSRSYIEEAGKILRYTFGLLELIFNNPFNKKDGHHGILTDWMREFLKSKNITWYQKINFFIYPLSYLNISSIIPVTIINFGLSGIGIQFPLIYLIITIPFSIVLYKVHAQNNKQLSERKKDLKTVAQVGYDIIGISFMFISFSYTMLKGFFRFIFKYDSGFHPTNVDNQKYNIKNAVEQLKDHFGKNKSVFLLLIPFMLIIFLMKPVFNAAFAASVFYIFAFIFASVILNPFIFQALKTSLDKKNENISLIFQNYKPDSFSNLNPHDSNRLSVFLTDDIRKFENKYSIINTGISVNGKTVWQIDIDGMLVFGTDNADKTELAEALYGSRILEKRIRAVQHLKKSVKLNTDSAVIVDEKTEDMYFKGKMAVVGSEQYAKTAAKILNSVSFMYAQKTIISLENISNGNLYSALSNGAVRKVISASQFEYLKNKFNSENKDIASEFLKLRKQGVEIYLSGESDVIGRYQEFSISGQILENKIYDYYSGNFNEVESVKEVIAPGLLKSKIINSDKPLLIDINILKKMFSGSNDIMETYDGFSALLGSVKIKFGLKDMNAKDMANFAYFLDVSEIPVLDDITDVYMVSAGIDNFADVMKLDSDNAVRIILQDAKINQDSKNAFLTVIKERVLVKTKLAGQNKENGLKDKKLEILLGKVLIMQVNNEDKISLLSEIEFFKGSEHDMTVKVNELYRSASSDKNPEILNTIVELILVYGEEYKTREIIKTNEDKITTYKTMLAAA